MNMKQFKYALVLANEKSFSRAAESLGISQPSLSQYLKKIETGARRRVKPLFSTVELITVWPITMITPLMTKTAVHSHSPAMNHQITA